MPNSIVVNGGTSSSTKTVNRTNAEWAAILGYFIEDWATPMPDGLTVAQQNQWRLDQATARVADFVESTARRNRRRDLAAAQTSIDDAAAADTSLG